MSVGATPLEIFRAKGIPHRRMEDWKYSDLRQVLDAEVVAHARPLSLTLSVPRELEQHEFSGRDDLPGWADHFGRQDTGSMAAAVEAFQRRAVALRVSAGIRVAEPLKLEFFSDGQAEIFLILEAGSSLTMIETHGEISPLSNIAMWVFLGPGAELTHVQYLPFAAALVRIESISLVQQERSRYHAFLLNGGGKLSRTDVNVSLNGESAEADLLGVSVLGEGAHADITTRIEHSAAHTTSRQLFKKVAAGKSRAVYQGKITVRQGAIGSDSRQTAKALLLSDRGETDLKPELEILADDVKCAHGAAVGDLDADSLFYLRSRGIGEREARALLVRAFLQEVVEEIGEEETRKRATEFIESGLARAMETSP